MGRSPSMILAICLATALLAGGSGCAAGRRSKAMQTERLLAAAGFQLRLADTRPEDENLKDLPKRQVFVQPHDGEVYYVYADDEFCRCVYVGSPRAYQRYEKMALEREIAQSQLRAAQAHQSAALSWGAWGPWYRPWY